MRDTLDKDIADASSLVSLLLVFAFAYFAAVVPQATAIIAEPSPEPQADKDRLAGRHKAIRAQMVGIGVVLVAVFALLLPLSYRIIRRSSLHGHFHTLRVGLILAELLLVATLVVAVRLWKALGTRIEQLK